MVRNVPSLTSHPLSHLVGNRPKRSHPTCHGTIQFLALALTRAVLGRSMAEEMKATVMGEAFCDRR